MSNRKLFRLLFLTSGALAYVLMHWESFWTLGRVIAGWYTIFVIVTFVLACLIWLSNFHGPVQHRPSIWDIFNF